MEQPKEPTIEEWKARALRAERFAHDIMDAADGDYRCDSDGDPDSLQDLPEWLTEVSVVDFDDIPRPAELLAQESDPRPTELPTDRVLMSFGVHQHATTVFAVMQRGCNLAHARAVLSKVVHPAKISRSRDQEVDTTCRSWQAIYGLDLAFLRGLLLSAPQPGPRDVFYVHKRTSKPRGKLPAPPPVSAWSPVSEAIAEICKDLSPATPQVAAEAERRATAQEAADVIIADTNDCKEKARFPWGT